MSVLRRPRGTERFPLALHRGSPAVQREEQVPA